MSTVSEEGHRHSNRDQKNGIGAEIVRTIGIIRARCKIGMTNLVYNMRRFVCLWPRPRDPARHALGCVS